MNIAIEKGQRAYQFCTDKALRAEVFAEFRAFKALRHDKQRAYKARSKFVRKRQRWQDDRRSNDDINPLVIGSAAWSLQETLTSAFASSSLSSFDHGTFASMISSFDDSLMYRPSPFDHRSPWSDWVKGGTDMTGGHGLSGHHDQFSSSSFSRESFAGSLSGDYTCSSGSSFSSHDPFA